MEYKTFIYLIKGKKVYCVDVVMGFCSAKEYIKELNFSLADKMSIGDKLQATVFKRDELGMYSIKIAFSEYECKG